MTKPCPVMRDNHYHIDSEWSTSVSWHLLLHLRTSIDLIDNHEHLCTALKVTMQWSFMELLATSCSQKLRHTLFVWILRIWCRPYWSGSPISICTSKRPGRKRASSSMSRLHTKNVVAQAHQFFLMEHIKWKNTLAIWSMPSREMLKHLNQDIAHARSKQAVG